MTSVDEEREAVQRCVFAADTREAISRARHRLAEWLKNHPDELGMRDGFELLDNMEECLEEAEREVPALGRAA